MGMKRGKLWSASHGAKREDKASNARGATLGRYSTLLNSDGPTETWSGVWVKASSRMGGGCMALKCWAHGRVASGPI
jgi:hypothetical protein